MDLRQNHNCWRPTGNFNLQKTNGFISISNLTQPSFQGFLLAISLAKYYISVWREFAHACVLPLTDACRCSPRWLVQLKQMQIVSSYYTRELKLVYFQQEPLTRNVQQIFETHLLNSPEKKKAGSFSKAWYLRGYPFGCYDYCYCQSPISQNRDSSLIWKPISSSIWILVAARAPLCRLWLTTRKMCYTYHRNSLFELQAH